MLVKPPKEARRVGALALATHALIATRGRSPDEVRDCNARFSRARDFLVHSEAAAIAGPAGSLTAAEMDSLRDEALSMMRAYCGACGLCARLGIEPP